VKNGITVAEGEVLATVDHYLGDESDRRPASRPWICWTRRLTAAASDEIDSVINRLGGRTGEGHLCAEGAAVADTMYEQRRADADSLDGMICGGYPDGSGYLRGRKRDGDAGRRNHEKRAG
jgi:hypothetical protein